MSGKGKDKGGKGAAAKDDKKDAGKDAGKGGKDAKGGKDDKKGGKDDKKDDKKGGKDDAKKEDAKEGDAKAEGGKPGKDDKGKKGKGKKKAEVEEGKEEDTEASREVKPIKEEEPEISAGSKRRARKSRYREKLEACVREYKNLLLASVDNVGSSQMQKIRLALRGTAVVLMGKNTIIRKVLREEGKTNPKLLNLIEHIFGNVGFVFTNGDLSVVRKQIMEHKVPAAARAGSFAPTDVFVPPGPTGMDPGQTAFFQALNIATKIQKGSIEIINTVHLIKAGEKVTSSAVALLSKLDMKPFFYGMLVTHVFEDGVVYSAKVLDFSKADLFAKFFNGVHKLTAISLEIGYPTLVALPQYFARAMEKLYSLSLATEYEFEESKQLKDRLANPGAYAAAPAAGGGGGGGGGGGQKEEEKKEAAKEEEPEEDTNMAVGGLFGDE